MARVIERIILAILAWLLSIAGAVKEQGIPEPATVAVETTTVWVEPETAVPETVPPQTAPVWQDGFVQYRVNGVQPPYDWAWYLYGQLADRGIAWYYPTAVCQIYQESNWSQWSNNGRDFGLCQQKGIYWDGRAAAAGIPGANIWDPYAQLYVYAWMMSEYLRATGYDVNQALSMYYTGTWDYSETYVGHVMRWMDYLEVVR